MSRRWRGLGPRADQHRDAEGANNRRVEVPRTVPGYMLCTTVAVEDGRILFFR